MAYLREAINSRRIEVLGVWYTINLIPMVDEGDTLFREAIININHALSDDKQELALSHELFEIFNVEHELGLPHHKIMTLGVSAFLVQKQRNI